MADRDAPTATNAVKAAEKRRRNSVNFPYQLPVTQDHQRQFNTVYTVAATAARQVAGHRTNTMSEYQTHLFRSGELRAFRPTPNPPFPIRQDLLRRARRTLSVDARVEAIVSWRGDSNASLAIPPFAQVMPNPQRLEDVYPSIYGMPGQEGRLAAVRSAQVPERQAEEINLGEEATQAAIAVIDEFFDSEAFERDQEAQAGQDEETRKDGRE